MRRLPRPKFTALEILQLCISSIRDSDLKQRLDAVSSTIETAELDYIEHGLRADLYQISATESIKGIITSNEMRHIYKNTFVKSNKVRYIYNSIKSSPENDIYPLCGQRTVSTLDHYLPQSTYPALVITSSNLIPACSDCNKLKLDIRPSEQKDQILHPYFDDVDSHRWLFATVKETKPAALVFSPVPPDNWSEIKCQRVKTHFKTFGLGQLYASHSAVELNNIRFGLQQLAQRLSPVRLSPVQISNHLQESANSRAIACINSWQAATYAALAESEWFCKGGFL